MKSRERGWLAAEVAVACSHRLSKLILVDPVGIKLGGPTTRDILDVFNVNPAELRRCGWHDPAKAPDFDAMSDEELVFMRAIGRRSASMPGTR